MASAGALAVLAAATSAQAQICAGLPSFSQAKANLEVGAEFGNNAKAFSGGLNLGGEGLFGSFAGNVVSFDNNLGTSVGAGASIGYQLQLGPTQRISLCPAAGGGVSFGPNNVDTGFGEVDFSGQSLAGGFSLGGLVPAGSNFGVIPTGSLSLVWARTSVKDDTGDSASDSDAYGVLSAGVGLLINDVFVIKPLVHIPIGLEGSDPTFGIVLSIALGRKH